MDMANINMPQQISSEEANKKRMIAERSDGKREELFRKYPGTSEKEMDQYLEARTKAIGTICDLVQGDSKLEEGILSEAEKGALKKLKEAKEEFKGINGSLEGFDFQFSDEADKKTINSLAKKIIRDSRGGGEIYTPRAEVQKSLDDTLEDASSQDEKMPMFPEKAENIPQQVSGEELNKKQIIDDQNDGKREEFLEKYPHMTERDVDKYLKIRGGAINTVVDFVHGTRSLDEKILTPEEVGALTELKKSKEDFLKANGNLDGFNFQFPDEAGKETINNLAKKIMRDVNQKGDKYVHSPSGEPIGSVETIQEEKKTEESVDNTEEGPAKTVENRKKKIPGSMSFETRKIIEKLDPKINQENLEVVSLDDAESGEQPIVGFNEAIILNQERGDHGDEKFVRIFRAVKKLDDLEQVPYASRSVDHSEGRRYLTKMKYAEEEVNELAENPTMEKLYSYMDTVEEGRPKKSREKLASLDWTSEEYFEEQDKRYPKFTDDEKRRYRENIAGMEDNILYEGSNLRKELMFEQIKHPGGVIDSGISPYVSVAGVIEEAAGYASSGGILVLDVPLSKVECKGGYKGEMQVRGSLDPKYISAILTVDSKAEKEDRENNAQRAMEKIEGKIKAPVLSEEEKEIAFKKRIEEDNKRDESQHEKDLEIIREKRVNKLVNQFHNTFAGIFGDSQGIYEKIKDSASEEGVDVYTKAKTMVFDYYYEKLTKEFKFSEEDVLAMEFENSSYKEEKIDKKWLQSKHAEDMLKKLGRVVDHYEAKNKNR